MDLAFFSSASAPLHSRHMRMEKGKAVVRDRPKPKVADGVMAD
jgi:hypothetical protein